MQRVLVIGPPGAGKSTFARLLGEKTGLPVIHLDQLYWLPGWVAAPPELYRQRLTEALAGERWIMDGNYSSSLDLRLPRADAVILFERSRIACLWRIAKRVVAGHGRVRADMARDCPERFDLAFMKLVWEFPRRNGRRTRDALMRHGLWDRTTTLRSDREAAAFLARGAPAGA